MLKLLFPLSACFNKLYSLFKQADNDFKQYIVNLYFVYHNNSDDGITPDMRRQAKIINFATIDGPVFIQPEEARKFIMRNISQGSSIDLVYRKDRWEYPLKAIRETVINAVVHRDYSILGSDIKIAIFDDMLETTSPGVLMSSVSPESLVNTPSEIRNRILAPLFKDCKLIEQWGSGFQKIYEELKEYPEIALKINKLGLSFQMQFIKTDYMAD
jgi:predicted HTH transcriptional regulator